MDKKEKMIRLLPRKRRLIQLYAALLYNAHVKGFIRGEIYTGSLKNLCVPGLNCYSCPGAVGACPLGALQNALASSGHRAPWYILGILMLFGLTFGRTVCGWLCPMGLLQELLNKLPAPKIQKSPITRGLSWLKYGILAVFVIWIPLASCLSGIPVPAFCKFICPAGTLEGAVGLLANPANDSLFSMLGALFTWKYSLLVLVLVASLFLYRPFCRFLCPLGAIYGLFSRVSLLGVKVEEAKCVNCGNCIQQCKMDIRFVGDHECIHCGKCIHDCPTQAISWKIAPKKPSHSRWKAWVGAILLLAAVLLLVNRDIPAETEGEIETIPIGAKVGMRCPDFTVPLYREEGTYCLSDHSGKPVVINFWATWCSPCVKELPNFQAIRDAYGDGVSIVAIHSSLVTEDVQAFLNKWEYDLPFALDADGSVLASLGGSTMLPMTVILDCDGIIVYNQVGSISYEQLVEVLSPMIDICRKEGDVPFLFA